MNLDASLSTAEGTQEGMIAPGQESLLEEFVQEQESAQQQAESEKLLGKFDSPEALAKAYQELERKMGRQGKPTQQETSAPADESAGGDDGEEVDTEDSDEPQIRVMTEEEITSIKEMVGGDEGFKQISQWARDNLSPDLLQEYNDVVSAGNVEAIRWAVRAMAIQAGGGGSEPLVEPELVGGGKPEGGLKFESQAQVLDAMNKRNERGQRLYDVDEAYRNKVQKALMRSDVF